MLLPSSQDAKYIDTLLGLRRPYPPLSVGRGEEETVDKQHYCAFLSAAALLAASLAIFSLRVICASTPMPPKTSPTPSHCICDSRWPKVTTDRIMVIILRVTVTVTR